MTPQELLIDRYEIIANYPNSPHKLGDIIDKNNCLWFEDFDWQNFPHIFKKLHWAEKRSIEDLPAFVKDDCSVKGIGFINCNTSVFLMNSDLLPATEEEYISYINSKK